MKTSDKLIGNLVQRVAVRLPNKSGRRIEVVEQDPIVKQTVAAIIDLSKYQISTVANTLGYVLEGVSKTYQIYEQNVPIEIMQSKLFVLRLLSSCMQHHWQFCRNLEKEKNKDIPINELNVVLPPLDDALVTFMLVLISRYVAQYHLVEESIKLKQKHNIPSITNLQENEYGYTYEQIKLSLVTNIYKASSKILYYISASNWDACYSKIKGAVLILGSPNGAAERIPPEIRMLGSSCLTKDRLFTIFTELTPYYASMKNEGRLLFSKMIRKAIWKWIEEYPYQFAEVCASKNTLLDDSGTLFDMCSNTADSSRKKAILWPLQTILLTLSPEFSLQMPLHNQGENFLSLLKKSLQSTKDVDIVISCYIDLYKSATYVPPSDTSVLHSIASNIEEELKDKVWDLSKYQNYERDLTMLGYSIDEQALITDFLVSSMRLRPEKTLKDMVSPCAEEEAPILFQLALVKSCLIIIEEDRKLPWNPNISAMYDGLCSPLRNLFLQAIRLDSNGTKKKESQSSQNHKIELLIDILHLFTVDTKLAILGNDSNRVEQNSAFMVGLMTLSQHPIQQIRQYALCLLVKMHQIDNILEWGPSGSILQNFWKISSPVMLDLAKKLLDNRSNEEALKVMFQLLNKLLKLRNRFLRIKQSLLTPEHANMRERLQATIALETALLYTLCSANKEICDEASQCIGLLCKEARIVDIEEDRQVNSLIIASNIKIYEELSSDDSRFIGRKAQQKRVRKYLRLLPFYTPGCIIAWQEAWKRWKQLTIQMTRLSEDKSNDTSTEISNSFSNSSFNSATLGNAAGVNNLANVKSALIRSGEKLKSINTTNTVLSMQKVQQNSESLEERAMEWQNITGFLAAVGGCCLADFESSIDIDDIASQVGVQSSINETATMVDQFVSDMTGMLVSENIYISEGARETLGNDLSPVLYVLLFQNLEKLMNNCFDSNGDAVRSPHNKMLVEQSVTVLKLILDRLTNPGDCLLNIDFSLLIHRFADYLNKLPNTNITLRIKVKMCLLIDTVMQKKEQIVIRDDVRLRNRLLEICVEWTNDFASQRKQPELGQQGERLQKELDHACLRAIVGLLHKLPLQPSEAIRPVDISQIKSKLFLKYFGFFRKLLDNLKQNERDALKYSFSSKDPSVKSFNTQSNDNYQDINQMKEMTIMAMSHLLSANVDAGLKFSLSLSYDDDHETRKAFMQVLRNILDQGAEFETLAESVITDRYEKLIDMIVDADMEIVMCLCEVCPSQQIMGIAEILLVCFESRQKVMSLLKAVIEKEISLTDQESTLFRGTTIATRILSIFAKQACLDYVRITLQPAMVQINNLPEDQLTWEMDPQKVNSVDEVLRNKQNVIRATEILLNAICSSVDNVPRAFREELSMIGEAVAERFPDAKFTAIGGFVFLRLLGPAILTPENAGFAKQTIPRNTNVRKILLQATRVMQNISNNVLFGAKETHMAILNDFLTNNISKVTNFLRGISVLPPVNPNEQVGGIRVDQTGYVKLHKYLSDNLERMSRNLTSRRVTKGDSFETQSVLGQKRTLDRLSNLLAQIGRPSEVPSSALTYARNYTIASSNHYYNDFMHRNAHRDLSTISSQNIFYMGAVSKGGRPVFYYVPRAMDPDETDHELLVYYMLRVMEPYLNNPFELLFDTTEFSSGRSLPAHWISQFFQLVFNEMNDYLVSLHLYNPNTYLQRYIRKLPRAIINKLVKRSHFSTSIAELSEYIAPSNIKLPKETLDLEKETTVTISSVTRLSNFRSSVPVIVKIGAEHMQVITVKKQEILYNINSVLRDVYHISNIEDMIALPSTKSETGGEISVKYDKGKSTMVLSTTKRDILLSNFHHYKQHYDATKPTLLNERAIRPNDVPGRLLNMALLNAGSEDPELRLAAYNLLYSLSLSFQFNIGNRLLNAKGLCIPANDSDFIVGVSESLANSEIHMTLEFLNEAFVGFIKSNEPTKHFCLDYMAPWLRNLAIFAKSSVDDRKRNLTKTKDIIRSFIDMTVRRSELYKHIQARIWKTIAQVDDLANLVIDCFVQYSVENGIGSVQAEIVTDTLVTMSSVSIRGKVISRIRRVIEGTSVQPCRNLTEHGSWPEIAILLRFILMLSFNNTDPVMPYIPEIFHIVSILVVTGPTFIRSSVHELVVNSIHTLCTMDIPLADENIKKLHFVLNDLCDSKNRVSFGLTKQHANAFTITKETTTDFASGIDLISLQNIIGILLDALTFGAPTIDVANMWRARWMSLVTSTAFYFNPAIQPRSFVTLGCLAREEVDDDLIYQILVALKGALAVFNESDSSLVISIIMCLTNIIDNMPSDSSYLFQLFWLAISLVHMGHASVFQTSVQFLESILRAMDSKKCFAHLSIQDALLDSQLDEIIAELDDTCQVNFKGHFSFAVAVVLLKGLKQCDNKDIVYRCLTTFLEIDCKRPEEQGVIAARSLGYFAGLLPFAIKDGKLRELLRLSGLSDVELDGIDFGSLFSVLDVSDKSTTLLLISLLVNLLNASDNESEKLYLYMILADAATCVPEVFTLIYDSLIPKMNQMLYKSQNTDIIDIVKNILLTACSEPSIGQLPPKNTSLEGLGFLSLRDPSFCTNKTSISMSSKFASKLLGCIVDHY